MTRTPHQETTLLRDIWISYRSQPLWVQFWVALILVPVNMASLLFLTEPMGLWIAILANIAMLSNLPIMLYERGFTNFMALPHILPWTILVCLILFARPPATGLYDVYLWVLVAVDLVSLVFDYQESLAWLKDRQRKAPPSA
ncbi:hypothetical protein GCM10007972_26440 [Iodidimonas muriae]|uniref:HXXEE domain-containing protein n=1 Tax=Iodidimonas muriae TaxID=261467 RepID=A0ABQ2LGC4_9PROT|nr:hypothetical protein [Iodidimonas muriae]GER08449.1 hypothetical protein JCM17843_27590 [Kordiimonadales bacterium JCM 17843]GGO16891.1 hypothetical protein GCM10007972_26440 [Iodidimonas muriae]